MSEIKDEIIIDGVRFDVPEETEIATAFDDQIGGDHYRKLGDYQPWKVLKQWLTPEELRGFAKGTSIVYAARERDKGGNEDLKKMVHTMQLYLELCDTDKPEVFDLIRHLERQRNFSLDTFGPGARVKQLLDHIHKELKEIKANPTDLEEWIDLILLAFDGAWRSGHKPVEICKALSFKQTKNESREWPDWRTADLEKAIEHIREK